MNARHNLLVNCAAFQNPQSDYRYHSARAKCTRRGRVLYIDYSGAISQPSFRALDMATREQRQGTAAAFECMAKALTLGGVVCINESVWRPDTPPSVMVVRPDQYDQALEFSRQLLMLGVVRLIFLTSQTQLAQAFVDRVAAR